MKKTLVFILFSAAAMFIAAGFNVDEQLFKEMMKQTLNAVMVGIGLGIILVITIPLFDEITGDDTATTPSELSLYVLIIMVFAVISMVATIIGWCYWQLFFFVTGYGG